MIGWYGAADPSSQRPWSTVIPCSAASCPVAAASLVLPTPGSPTMTTVAVAPAATSSSVAASCACSVSRPTIGDATARTTAAGSGQVDDRRLELEHLDRLVEAAQFAHPDRAQPVTGAPPTEPGRDVGDEHRPPGGLGAQPAGLDRRRPHPIVAVAHELAGAHADAQALARAADAGAAGESLEAWPRRRSPRWRW